jgi:hypothetical protein
MGDAIGNFPAQRRDCLQLFVCIFACLLNQDPAVEDPSSRCQQRHRMDSDWLTFTAVNNRIVKSGPADQIVETSGNFSIIRTSPRIAFEWVRHNAY